MIDDRVFPPNDLSLPIGLPLLTKSLSRSECSLLSIDMTNRLRARFAEARLRIGRLLSLADDVSLRKWRATPANGMVRPYSRPASDRGWSGSPIEGARDASEDQYLGRRRRHRFRQELVPRCTRLSHLWDNDAAIFVAATPAPSYAAPPAAAQGPARSVIEALDRQDSDIGIASANEARKVRWGGSTGEVWVEYVGTFEG